MLRFPYLLSLLLCIELSLCYSYIDEDAERRIHNRRINVRSEKVRRVRRPNVRRSPVRQEEDYDRSPVEFDVASFIQPEEDNLEAEEVFRRHRSNKRRWSPKPYDPESMIEPDDSINKMEKTPDYMSMTVSLPDLSMSPHLSKDLMNAKYFGFNSMEDINSGKYGNEKYRNVYKDDLLMNQNGAHYQQKKCSLKSIKFPFFSHNKSELLKPKKPRKRKLFFFKSKKEVSKIPDINKMNDYTMIPYKKKRSYEQRLCPACRKIFVTTEGHGRLKKRPKSSIHNSRQFFQNTSPDVTLKEEIPDYGMKKELSNDDNRYRSKREDRERQLKELEQVQKKIEAVEIKLPHFETPAEKKINKDVYN